MSALEHVDRRFWLVPIAAPAGVAIWSGWVGLGGMTGFGVVHPLPGIWDGLTLNTAITLPIGVEAYAAYALSIATSGRDMPAGAKRFAGWSSVAALVLGMLGQTAYHLMAAAGVRTAPWVVTVIVSCLPVAVLGAAAYLFHLARVRHTAARPAAQARPRTAAPAAAPDAGSAVDEDQAQAADATAPRATALALVPSAAGLPRERAIADALAWRAQHGDLPTLSQLRALGRPRPHAQKTAQRALLDIRAREAA